MYKLSPSDFAYLWQNCKHCYYQKVKHKVAHSGSFPSMFGRINSLLQNSIMGMNLQMIDPMLPSGIVEIQEGYMRSKPVTGVEDCYISGRFDILSRLDDGSFAVIDFKITTPEEEKIKNYASQLHAYKYALENPDNGKEPIHISTMGVVSVNPEDMTLSNGKIIFTTKPTWHPIANDMASFYELVAEISKVLNGECPDPSPECDLCTYRGHFSGQQSVKKDDFPF